MSEFEFNFSKKNILIVGGSSGIGYEAAVLFSKLKKLLSVIFDIFK